jgi:L-amino acid N-acyltransferase YncA
MPVMSNEIRVRDAVASDADGICAIYNAALAERSSTFETEPRGAADFETRIEDPRFPFLVSDRGKGVLGWAGLAPYSARECYAGIAECSVYVAAPARGQGIGTDLTDSLTVVARRSGFHKMIGRLFVDNVASVRLVKRCGFQHVGVHRRHGRLDGAWFDVLVVELLLNDARKSGRARGASPSER